MVISIINLLELVILKIINIIDLNFLDEFGLFLKEIVKKKYFLEEE